MTMNFRTAKSNVVDILGAAAASRFQVVEYQVQGSGASEFLSGNRKVQVFYDSGDFSKGKADLTGPQQHDVTLNVWLTVTAQSEGDLSVLEDSEATAAAKAAALVAFDNAALRADNSIDELFDIVYQILMDGNNLDLGFTGVPHVLSSRFISGMQKNQPQDFGEFVVLTGSITFNFQVVETLTGDTGTAAVEPAIDITNEIEGVTDDQKTGAEIGG